MLNNLQINIAADIDAISRIPAVENILEVVCRTTGMGFAAVARVTETKWVTCAVLDKINFGLVPGSELVLETTICDEIRQNHQAVVIDHVAEDPHFAQHHTPLMYGFQSYISMPIMLKDGSFFGTLCAIDPNPNVLNTPETVGMFKLFAELIAFHLESIEQLAITQTQLLEEQKNTELREQFIAILGHDLRNPVSAISNVAQMLLRMPLDERTARLAQIAQDSSFRMKGLIENILDFASGRLGGGIVLSYNDNEPVAEILNQVITELNMIWPGRVVETSFNFIQPVNCDGKRIAQLFSNLLSNAYTHGDKETPIRVVALSNADGFTLSVANSGFKIPDAAIARLFQPFSRGEVKRGQKGLGLGLYIASQIADAHGGTLDVISTNEETKFTLHLPG